MKQAVTGLLVVCVLMAVACGRNPVSPSTLASAAPSGVSLAQAAQHASEQVVFSGVATTSSTFPNSSPAGFWIWCEAESENPYEGECNGSMYFYALGITKHVEGEVTEPSEGIYRMDVSSTHDDTIHCILMKQAEAVHGPNNTVTVTCTTPSGSATSTSAVVNVTGPPE
jgi:hypothetical protein